LRLRLELELSRADFHISTQQHPKKAACDDKLILRVRGSAPVSSGEFIRREVGSITRGSFRGVIKWRSPDMYVPWNQLV
jgi:hypothetical protein